MDNRKPTVAILMSTYNGAKYLRDQIESILQQNNVSIQLFIRDDGSTDGTIELIREYEYKNHSVHYKRDNCNNLGPGISFLRLLYDVVKNENKFDYYAFADQDDIWLPNKMNIAAKKLQQGDIPSLYCSNQILYKNAPGGKRFAQIPDLSFKGHITCNYLSGCTMVINYALAEYATAVPFPSKNIIEHRFHDSWIFLVALLKGEVMYDNDAYIYYRIHENNVIGLSQLSVWDRILRVFRFNGKSRIKNLRLRLSKELLTSFPDMKIECKEILSEFAYYQDSIRNKVKLIQDKEICEISGENYAIFVVKVIFNYV